MMDLLEYIYKCKKTDKDMPVDYYFLGLASEAGEVCDIRKQMLRGDKLGFPRDEYILELGDVMWYVMMLCEHLNISIVDVMDQNIAKLKKRHGSKE